MMHGGYSGQCRLGVLGALGLAAFLAFSATGCDRVRPAYRMSRIKRQLPHVEVPATENHAREASQLLDPREHRIGELIADLEFEDLEGRPGKLSDYADHRAVVIAMRDSGCPVAQRQAPRLSAIEAEYRDQGVAFLWVNSSHQDTIEDMLEDVERYGLAGRHIPDKEGLFGSELGARTTTDIFVLDAARTLAYRGAVSDRVGRGTIRQHASQDFLEDALDAVLAGKRVGVSATTAPGCFAEFKPRQVPDAELTYHNRISRIVQNNCQRCHRPGGAGPFELLTYDDVFGWRMMIEYVVFNRIMPYWLSDRDGRWANDPSLSDRDREDFLAWMEAGAPEGDPADAPLPIDWGTGWQIGEPDVIVEIPEPIEIPAEGYLEYQLVSSSVPMPAGWVKKIQILPDVPEVVHHVAVFYRHPEGGRMFFGGLLPGGPPTVYGDGLAKYLPEGATLDFDIHYTPNGTAVTDQLSVGFTWAERPPVREVFTLMLQDKDFTIPAGHPNYPVVFERRIPEAIQIETLQPHMHLRGKSFQVEFELPDGEIRRPLSIDKWDPDWQFPYRPAEPILLPKNTILRVTASFDNSSSNENNPDPTVDVQYGIQIWDEMAGLLLQWTLP